MDNSRFLAILNRAARESGLDLTSHASASDPGAVASWAAFLRACVAAGVSIADPRWQALEIRAPGGSPSLALASDAADGDADGEADFTLGLSLLISMLGRNADRDDG